jgi:hypothetical protein
MARFKFMNVEPVWAEVRTEEACTLDPDVITLTHASGIKERTFTGRLLRTDGQSPPQPVRVAEVLLRDTFLDERAAVPLQLGPDGAFTLPLQFHVSGYKDCKQGQTTWSEAVYPCVLLLRVPGCRPLLLIKKPEDVDSQEISLKCKVS